MQRLVELKRIRYELLDFITEPEAYDKEKAMAKYPGVPATQTGISLSGLPDV